MPVGDVLVGDTRGNVEHDDTGLAVDVVSITETTKLLLTSGVPHVELDLSEVLFSSVGRHKRAGDRKRTVVKPRGWTSTPSVAMYFFSNSPVKWRLTKVVCGLLLAACLRDCGDPLSVSLPSWNRSHGRLDARKSDQN